MRNFDEVNKGKELHRMENLFTTEKIEKKIKEMYPSMEQPEVNYHVAHLEDNDCLKVAIDENGLEESIEEQVGHLREDI